MKKVLVSVVMMLLVASVGFGTLYVTSYDPQSVVVSSLETDGGILALKAHSLSSSMHFRGYRLLYEDDALIIQLHCSLIPLGNEREITITEKLDKTIQKIYLEGKSKEDRKQIWP